MVNWVAGFTNDFEEGNFTAWTGTSSTPTIVLTPVHHNSYAAQFDVTGEDCYYNFADTTQTPYCRFYIQLNALPAAGQSIRLSNITSSGNVYVGVKNSGSVFWWVRDAYGIETYAASGPAVNTWYCFEWAHLAATVPLWIDELKVAEGTGVAFDNAGFRVGQ